MTVTLAGRPDIALHVTGELTAASSDLETRLEAAGDSLRWHVPDLSAFLASLPVLRRNMVATRAAVFARSGLTLEIHDDRGPLLRIGAGERSRLGRLVVGSPYARFHRPLRWALAWVRRRL